ncbi:MAG: NADH-quinone oxidoreductase subunit NuoH [Candidatus Abyssobacteria bacterium SURF_17]|uniref:NADH-quinone oxidoreductase subunit H n=1 Tax=Candidatus Abyssobacteria bacterium SURF_17 TaxID=2093361 RepID=A0A419EW70_9BACT|nr:MAG: NADH-quinone oxidoreductase subunit NuoH [Candidatus Abyssubacteria bacterium SURF_17]
MILAVKIAIAVLFVLNLAGLLTWAERRQSAFMQDRLGPNRANVFGVTLIGLLHPVADGIKMMMKEDFVPAGADRIVHTLAPFIALFPAFVAFAVIPFGDRLPIFGYEVNLVVSEINVGLLFVVAVMSLAIFGVFLGGWASNNKWSLLGALRSAAQMISYEVTLGLTIIGVLMVYQSLRLDEIVRAQGDLLFGFIPKWGIVTQPLGFLLFFAAAMAETKRTPFDLPEGESEIVAGYFLEYSGMKWGMFFMGEFAEIVVIAGVVTSLFLGGWQIPWVSTAALLSVFPGWLVALIQIGVFSVKVVILCWLQLTVRWTLPRFRYDQLMRLGWKMLLPISLANIFVTGAVILLIQHFKGV